MFLLATADLGGGPEVPGAAAGESVPAIPDFLEGTQLIRLAELSQAQALERLWRGLEAEGLKDDFALPERPYPGLEAFQETDVAVFFGRGEDIARVCAVLNRCRRGNVPGFILVLGTSGCGKSSLVRAGVLPRLQSRRRRTTWASPTRLKRPGVQVSTIT